MTKAKTEIIEVAALDLQKVNIRIVGETPLIVHAWSQKAKQEILNKQMKVTKTNSFVWKKFCISVLLAKTRL